MTAACAIQTVGTSSFFRAWLNFFFEYIDLDQWQSVSIPIDSRTGTDQTKRLVNRIPNKLSAKPNKQTDRVLRETK
jgi:hypothetical protein